MLQNAPTCSKMLPKLSQMLQKCLKCSNASKRSKMFQYGPKCSKMLLNDPKCSKMIANAAKRFKILQNHFKYSKSGPNVSIKIQRLALIAWPCLHLVLLCMSVQVCQFLNLRSPITPISHKITTENRCRHIAYSPIPMQ